MKQELKENGGLPAHILWTLAIVAGVSVANIYYNQPLLNLIRQELGITEFSANLIAMITQVGYALGLLQGHPCHLGRVAAHGYRFHDSPNLRAHRLRLLSP